MTKRLFFFPLVVFFCFAIVRSAFGQTDKKDVDKFLNNLRSPDYSAMVLLDQSTAKVERITTPQGLAVGVLNLASQQNFGIAVAPYWLCKHKDLDFNKFIGIDTSSGRFWRNIASASTFSLATLKPDSSVNRFLSLGFSTNLITCKRYNLPALKKQVDTVQKRLSDLALKSADSERKQVDSLKKQVDSLKSEIEKGRESLMKSIYDQDNINLFLLKFAAAHSLVAVNNDADRIVNSRSAAWLTGELNLRLCKEEKEIKTHLEIIFLGRYLYDHPFLTQAKGRDFFDAGARIGLNTFFSFGGSDDERKNFNASIEYVYRETEAAEQKGHRIAFILEQQVMNELFLTASFGKDHTSKNNLFALLGINFGFSSKSVFGKESR